MLDTETAAKFSVGSSTVDSMIRVDLPDELAGPILPIEAELVFELRPRLGAGLHVALMMHEDRFRELLIPGQKPDVVSCLLESGPVRLQRDLDDERRRVQDVVDKFGLQDLSSDGLYHWIAETDDMALDLLAKFYGGGDATPRIIWPEGESLRVRGEITPSALKVQIDDGRDWFGTHWIHFA